MSHSQPDTLSIASRNLADLLLSVPVLSQVYVCMHVCVYVCMYLCMYDGKQQVASATLLVVSCRRLARGESLRWGAGCMYVGVCRYALLYMQQNNETH